MLGQRAQRASINGDVRESGHVLRDVLREVPRIREQHPDYFEEP